MSNTQLNCFGILPRLALFVIATQLTLVIIICNGEMMAASTASSVSSNAPAASNGQATFGGANSAVGKSSTVLQGSNNTRLEDERAFEEYRRATYYVEPFEKGMISVPAEQRKFVREMVRKHLDLFGQVLREAIDKKDNFGAGVSLSLKYSMKLIGQLIKHYKGERAIPGSVKYKAEFYKMFSRMFETALLKSNDIKSSGIHSKSNVNTEEAYHRVDAIFNWVDKIVQHSPVGGYMKWNETLLYKNEPQNPLHDRDVVDEAADLLAVSNDD